ncbi:MAG: hypothetical protein FIB08_13415 [Candidatus Methanoperedens sp.]|nr:hypothetical protein [Candidatus Methanoperedens sp.]
MKNNQLNILTSLVAAMFILGLFTGLAAAQTPAEQYEKTREQYQIHKDKYDRTKEKFNGAQDLFEKALKKFRETKDNQSKDELRLKFREYLIKAIDHGVSHLEVLKYRAELAENRELFQFDVSANIDVHIKQLEKIRTDVQQADTDRELLDAYNGLKDLWIKVRLETRYYVGIVLNHRISNFIEKTDNVSARTDAAIQDLKAQGKDTSKLEEKAASFENLMNEAKDSYQETRNLFEEHKGFASDGTVTDNKDAQTFVNQGNSLQKETVRKLKAASRELLDFVKEYRKLSGGRVIVSGTGRLEANGTGRALIRGNVTATVSGNATLVVSSGAKVTTDGTGTKETLGNGDVKYTGFGSATITGENIRIEISGNVTLTAEGTGSAVLSGRGSYHTEKSFTVSGEWQKEG